MGEPAAGRRYGITDLPILDALRRTGCPPCRVAAASSARYLRNLFHEYVNDPHMHGRLHASWGFCPTHTDAAVAEARREGDLLGFAILAQSIVAFIASRLYPATGKRRKTKPRNSEGRCPACEAGHQAAVFMLHRLPELMDTDEFGRWRASGGRLCSPHLQLNLAVADENPEARAFLDQERQLLDSLVMSLGEYVRKCDWQYRHEAKEDEQAAPTDAAHFFAGDS